MRERYLAEESADQTLARVERAELRRTILTFIPLMQGAGETAIITRWVAAAIKELDLRRRADLGHLALTLATLKDWYPAWKEALKEWNMLESPYVLELQAEATRKATLKAKREDLKMFLEGRFGPLPLELLQRIEATTDLAKIDQLVQAASRINRLEELPG